MRGNGRDRAGILGAVSNWLKLLALIVLVAEAMILAAMKFSPDSTVAPWYPVAMLSFLVVVVVGVFLDRFTQRTVPEATPDETTIPERVISIEVDPEVAEASIKSRAPSGWHQRALYLGTEGARGWMAVVEHEDYLSSDAKALTRRHILGVLRAIRVSTFISLGPGDAAIDQHLAMCLLEEEPELIYLPVDISEGLLSRAVRLLSTRLKVPVGIQGDFESGLPFIIERLRTRIKPPVLTSVVGYTLGNLDEYETPFLRQLQSWLAKRDYLLLEVLTPGEHFDPESVSLQGHSQSRRFIANGVSWQCGLPIEEVMSESDHGLEQRPGHSDVPGTISIDFVDPHREVKVQTLRYYKWESFLKWLEDGFGFEVIKERSFPLDAEDSSGIVLLRHL